jgi:hypothetical protein
MKTTETMETTKTTMFGKPIFRQQAIRESIAVWQILSFTGKTKPESLKNTPYEHVLKYWASCPACQFSGYGI